MICLIISIIGLILFVLVIIVGIKWQITLSILWEVMILLSFLFFLLPLLLCIYGNTTKVDEVKFRELSIIADHFDELPNYSKVTCGNEIMEWNEHLNDFNNVWFKFEVEDRNKYIILIKEN